MNRFLTALLLASVSITAAAQAPVRIRGTVEKLDNLVLTVKTRAGDTVNIKLAEKYVVAGVARASLADVVPGKYIGTATLGQKDGALVALEVLIFPDAMRGANEGHYPWDLQPESMMTNATVATVADAATGAKERTLTLKYKDGEKQVLVPEGTPIVTFVPADRAELKPGVHVFAITQRASDGGLSAARVNVGLGGIVPPM